MNALHTALNNFANLFQDPDFTRQLGEALNCEEINAFDQLLTAAGRHDEAAALVTEHSYTDDEGDEHHEG